MECPSKLQTTQLLEIPESIECKKTPAIELSDSYDEKSRKYWKYLAQQEALRRLEQIKTHALVSFRR